MQNLLYSIRAIKPGNPPFTFDNLPRGFDRGVWTNEKQPTDVSGATAFQVMIGVLDSEKGYRKGSFGSIDNTHIRIGDKAYEIEALSITSNAVSLVLTEAYQGSTILYDYVLHTTVADFSGETGVASNSNTLGLISCFEASIFYGNVSDGDSVTLTLKAK